MFSQLFLVNRESSFVAIPQVLHKIMSLTCLMPKLLRPWLVTFNKLHELVSYMTWWDYSTETARRSKKNRFFFSCWETSERVNEKLIVKFDDLTLPSPSSLERNSIAEKLHVNSKMLNQDFLFSAASANSWKEFLQEVVLEKWSRKSFNVRLIKVRSMMKLFQPI